MKKSQLTFGIEEGALRTIAASGAKLEFELREFEIERYHLIIKVLSQPVEKVFHLAKTQRPGLRTFRSLDRAIDFVRKLVPWCSDVRVVRLQKDKVGA